MGWKGLYIEPVTEFCNQCRERHKNNEVDVIECSIGSEEKEVDLYVSGPLTTTNSELPSIYSSVEWAKDFPFSYRRCQQRRLESVLSDCKITPGFDLLVVDVEGSEESVFNSFDLTYWGPKMIIIERIDSHPSFQPFESHISPSLSLRAKLQSQGYLKVYADEINTVFVKL